MLWETVELWRARDTQRVERETRQIEEKDWQESERKVEKRIDGGRINQPVLIPCLSDINVLSWPLTSLSDARGTPRHRLKMHEELMYLQSKANCLTR